MLHTMLSALVLEFEVTEQALYRIVTTQQGMVQKKCIHHVRTS